MLHVAVSFERDINGEPNTVHLLKGCCRAAGSGRCSRGVCARQLSAGPRIAWQIVIS